MGIMLTLIFAIFILILIFITCCVILNKNVKEFHIKIGKRFEISSTFFNQHHQ